MERFQITEEGYKKLKAELERLKDIERPNIIQAIKVAREHGDLKENAEYSSAKEKQSFIEAQIGDFEDKLNRSEVIDISKQSGDRVKFGATVKLEDLDSGKTVTYKIVSEFESDIDSGLISATSPVARALIDKQLGATVEVKVPARVINYEIVGIEFK